MNPLVSILIPAYNAEKWIADTIRSAMAQTWQNTEIIVVRIHLEIDRTFGLETVFVGERAVSLFEELSHVRTHYGYFFFVQLDFEVCGIESHEMFETVEQLERVVGPLIE